MEEESDKFRVSSYRWVILLLFSLYSSINFLQFLQYSIITNITAKYYEIADILVDLTGLIFMITFVLLCLPFNYLIEKYTLRTTSIVSSGLTTFGNLLKLASVSRDRFYLALIGQTLCAIGQVFMLSIPSKLASTWFGANEVSTACAIAILGTQIGVAIGCITPPYFVKDSDDIDEIGAGFKNLMIINAAVTVAIFGLVLLFFRAKPEVPPSLSQVERLNSEKVSMWSVVKNLGRNREYLLLLGVIGSSNGMYSCFGVMVGGVYIYYFPGYNTEVGIISALAVLIGGCLGSVVFGYILDKWHSFKVTTFAINLLSALSYIFVILTLELKAQILTYFSIPIFGFFVASTLLVGFEFATEVTYPIPEAASCAVLNSVIYIFSIVYTLAFGALFDKIGYLCTHIIIVILFALSSLEVLLMRPVLHRREANIKNENSYNK